MTNFERVREFNERFGHPVATAPALPSDDIRRLRLRLIDEDRYELLAAESDDDLVEVADALTDLLYVIYGMGHVYGIDLDQHSRTEAMSNFQLAPGETAGEKSPCAKLTNKQAAHVRLWVANGVPRESIAAMLGISLPTICKVVKGRSYSEG